MVLITNHGSFDYRELADLGVAVIDTRNAFEGVEGSHIYKIGMAVSIPEKKEVVSLLA